MQMQRNVLKMKGKATVFNNCYLKWNSNFVGSILCRHIHTDKHRT